MLVRTHSGQGLQDLIHVTLAWVTLEIAGSATSLMKWLLDLIHVTLAGSGEFWAGSAARSPAPCLPVDVLAAPSAAVQLRRYVQHLPAQLRMSQALFKAQAQAQANWSALQAAILLILLLLHVTDQGARWCAIY